MPPIQKNKRKSIQKNNNRKNKTSLEGYFKLSIKL